MYRSITSDPHLASFLMIWRGMPSLANQREPLTRDKLMSLARGREWSAMERSIDVQVSRLRRLLEDDPSKPRYIQTVWGVGYVFVPD